MHRVVQSHLGDFSKKYSVIGKESKQFEAFINYISLRGICAEAVDPNELVYEGDDPGIDGVMVFLDDIYVSSMEEVEDYFKIRKRDVDASIIFTQAKTSESWDKGEINIFQSAVVDFLSTSHSYPHSSHLAEAREIFDKMLQNVGKIRSGRPSVKAFFATTSRESTDREIVAARDAMEASLFDTGYFESVQVALIDRGRIVEMWTAAEGQVEAVLKVLGMAAFPKAPGIEEGYAVTVKAKDFIEQILSDSNGRLRKRIFEENVRDFLGADAEINSEMTGTLQDPIKQKRFGILNNGITIISPDVRVTGFEIFMRDFQIVNGCQTSNVLFENRASVSDDATLMLKVVETSDASVVDDIVRSTNRQAKVEEDQFLATLDSVKALERYFDARGADEEYRLYFERRKNQFSAHENVKAIRVFDIKEIARSTGAMFLDKPEIASRYPNRLTGELRELVFDKGNFEEPYHLAAYALYRVKLLGGNGRLGPKYSKLRWHILMAIKYYVLGDNTPKLNSTKIKTACSKLEKFISANDEVTITRIRELCVEIAGKAEPTRDKIKSPSFAADVKARALTYRVSFPPA